VGSLKGGDGGGGEGSGDLLRELLADAGSRDAESMLPQQRGRRVQGAIGLNEADEACMDRRYERDENCTVARR
jgi:hypothetical protein